MLSDENTSRREFLKRSSAGVGGGIAGLQLTNASHPRDTSYKKLPREITIAAVSLVGWPDQTTELRLDRIFSRMDDVAAVQPDVVCLPELFATMWVTGRHSLSDIAEDERSPGPVTSRVAAFAKKHSCYVTCPVVTVREGRYYNSSLLLDRQGKIAGVYHKIHPTKTEMLPDHDFIGEGVTPGALNQPVVVTEFGKVGMQICYDANWTDGWDNLAQQSADVVLFSSAFPGGRMLNYHAVRSNCLIASATGQDARIIDISGNDLDASSEFVRYAWRTVNLEKVNVTTWPTCDRLPDLLAKYRDRIAIKVWGNTHVITVESRDPGLRVTAILKEFDIPVARDFYRKEAEVQAQYRQG